MGENLVTWSKKHAGYDGSISEQRSINKLIFLGENLVTWSKKQPVVVRSSIKVEFRPMGQTVSQMWWNFIMTTKLPQHFS